MTSARLLVLAAVAALALVGCGVEDDGQRTTQVRDVDAFTRIDNRGSVDLELHVGDPQRVRVLAGEKVIDDVRTTVQDGTLEVILDHDGSVAGPVTVEASVPQLTAVTAIGSGDIDADGVETDVFDVRSEGSADIGVSGIVDRLAVNIDGSSDVDLADLVARDARVVVSGSGGAEVRADRLNASVEGSGGVRYHGDPLLTEHVEGSGDISRAG